MTTNPVQPLRAAVVGLGWAGETHLKAYKTIPGVSVVALSDSRPEQLERVQQTHDVPDGHTDWHELVERDDIDVISVATPNYLHMPIAVAALGAGKHVLTEKPIARSAAEARQMVDAAKAAGRVLDVSFNHRKRGDVEALKQMIDDGLLGRVYYAKAYWMRRRGVPYWGGWFAQSELAGGGPMIDIGVHMLDMALFLLGEPDVLTVSGAAYSELAPRGRGASQPLQGPFDVEDLASAFIRLEGGGSLYLEASWAGYGQLNDNFGVELFGTDAGAMIDNHDWTSTNTLRVFQDLGGAPAVSAVTTGRGEGHVATVRDFIATVRSGDWAGHIGLEGLKRARIIEAAYQSAAQGREVVLGAS